MPRTLHITALTVTSSFLSLALIVCIFLLLLGGNRPPHDKLLNGDICLPELTRSGHYDFYGPCMPYMIIDGKGQFVDVVDGERKTLTLERGPITDGVMCFVDRSESWAVLRSAFISLKPYTVSELYVSHSSTHDGFKAGRNEMVVQMIENQTSANKYLRLQVLVNGRIRDMDSGMIFELSQFENVASEIICWFYASEMQENKIILLSAQPEVTTEEYLETWHLIDYHTSMGDRICLPLYDIIYHEY